MGMRRNDSRWFRGWRAVKRTEPIASVAMRFGIPVEELSGWPQHNSTGQGGRIVVLRKLPFASMRPWHLSCGTMFEAAMMILGQSRKA